MDSLESAVYNMPRPFNTSENTPIKYTPSSVSTAHPALPTVPYQMSGKHLRSEGQENMTVHDTDLRLSKVEREAARLRVKNLENKPKNPKAPDL